MAKKKLKTAHVPTVTDYGGGHSVSEAVQRDIRQAQTVNEPPVCSIEAGGRQRADIARQLTPPAKLVHQRRRHRNRPDRRTRLRRAVHDLAGIKPHSLVADIDLAPLKVNVSPAKAADFPAAEAQDQAQGQGQGMTMRPERGHIDRDLIVRPGSRRLLDMRGTGNALHGVPRKGAFQQHIT